MTRMITLDQLHDEARARFGNNPQDWAYQCPECGDVATGSDVAHALSQRPAAVAARNPLTVSQILGQRCIACPARAREFPHLDRAFVHGIGRPVAVFPLAPKETQ